MISYAQNFEDVMLARVFAGLEAGFYVDVGAWDPEVDSVTKHFYDSGWSGINIEPHPLYYAKLVESRPRDVNLDCAISDIAEDRPFFVFEETGTSTLDRSFSDHFTDRFAVREMVVRTRTLDDVLGGSPREIAFLKIDAEGWEGQIIRSIDWVKYRPVVVVVEAVDPLANPAWDSWEPMLLEHKFDCVYFDGLNRFYLACERADLKHAFGVPPNVFDRFVLHREHVVAQRFAAQESILAAANAKLQECVQLVERTLDSTIEILEPNPLAPEAQKLQALTESACASITKLQARQNEAASKAAAARIWAGELEQARALEFTRNRNVPANESSDEYTNPQHVS